MIQAYPGSLDMLDNLVAKRRVAVTSPVTFLLGVAWKTSTTAALQSRVISSQRIAEACKSECK